MKTKRYSIVTKSSDFRDHVVDVIKNKYELEVSYNMCVTSWYIDFTADKKTYKSIKKDLGLIIRTVYLSREMD